MARALRKANAVNAIVGFDKDPAVSARAKEIGVIDEAAKNFAAAVSAADLIIVAAPVGAIADIASAVNDHAKSGALIIDVGSVKGAVADAAAQLRQDIAFVPCHPVAGTEQSGPDAGFAELFDDRWCIITPLDRGGCAVQGGGRASESPMGTLGRSCRIHGPGPS